jgi:hypothetical protein
LPGNFTEVAPAPPSDQHQHVDPGMPGGQSLCQHMRPLEMVKAPIKVSASQRQYREELFVFIRFKHDQSLKLAKAECLRWIELSAVAR